MDVKRVNTGIFIREDLLLKLDLYKGELSRSRAIEYVLEESLIGRVNR